MTTPAPVADVACADALPILTTIETRWHILEDPPLVTTTVTYHGDLHCRAEHGPSGATFETDAPRDNQGKGENFSPTDLVGAALGSCILTVMGIAARGLGVDISGATARVEKEMAAAPTRRIARLVAEVRVPHEVEAGHRERLEAAARNCPVHKSIHPDIDAPILFTWGTNPA
jgi:putative redox protein